MLTNKTWSRRKSRRLLLKWTVEDVTLLIEAVSDAPVLWACHKREHLTKHRQWQLISQNVFEKRISPNELKQKWQNLRSQFYACRAENTPVHEVRWRYYSKLLFLLPHNRPIKLPPRNEGLTAGMADGIKVDDIESISDLSRASNIDDPIITNMPFEDFTISNVTSIEPKTSSIAIQTDGMAQSFNYCDQILSDALQLIPTRQCDDSQIFGDYVALQMRRISLNKRLALEVKIQKLIWQTNDEPELKPEIQEDVYIQPD